MTCPSRHPIRQFMFALFLACFLILPPTTDVAAADSDLMPFIVLSCYRASIPIDGELTLIAFTSNGKIPKIMSLRAPESSVQSLHHIKK